tara:strand:+ start:1098 stop:1538 length:441 start_codon:yes stop_codon:yes gene_type:complete
MKKLLWLDDIRNPFIADWLTQYAPQFAYGEGETTWVKSYNEFVDWINTNGLPDMVAFDHDLGEDVAKDKVANGMSKKQARLQKRETMSGYDCAKWLVKYCINNDIELPQWTVQSANPVGRDNINGLLNCYRAYFLCPVLPFRLHLF